MPFVIVDGVIVNDAFATPATPGTSSLVDGVNNQQFSAGASQTNQPVDGILGLTTWSSSDNPVLVSDTANGTDLSAIVVSEQLLETSFGVDVCGNSASLTGADIVVTWVSSSDPGVVGYYVYWDIISRSGGDYTSYSNYQDVIGQSAQTCIITGLTVGTTYYFNISSHGAGGHDVFESELFGEISLQAIGNTNDIGVASDSAALSALSVSGDSVSGYEALLLSAQVAVSDSSTGSDSTLIDQGSAPVTGNDAGSGSDIPDVTVSTAVSDPAAGSESTQLTAISGSSDNSAGTDLSVIDVQAVSSDTGTSSDAVFWQVDTLPVDNGVANEIYQLSVDIKLVDSATGLDAAGIDTGVSIPIDVFDFAAGIDFAVIEAPIQGGGWVYPFSNPYAPQPVQQKLSKSSDRSYGEESIGISVQAKINDASIGNYRIDVVADVYWSDNAIPIDEVAVSAQIKSIDKAKSKDSFYLSVEAFIEEQSAGKSSIAIEKRLSRHVIEDQLLMAIGVF